MSWSSDEVSDGFDGIGLTVARVPRIGVSCLPVPSGLSDDRIGRKVVWLALSSSLLQVNLTVGKRNDDR
jgi:hypothetical protein